MFISTLEDQNGILLSSEDEIESEVVSFFERLYTDEDKPRFVIDGLDWVPLQRQHSEDLERPFQVDEIYRAIKDIGSSKSPGPDGMTEEFYKSCWNTLKPDIVEVFQEFFENGIITKRTNEKYICLIP